MPKRKRGTDHTLETTVSNKKRTSDRHLHETIDADIEYKVRDIVGETKTKYLIDWEPDEVTGASYPQTWEPKSNVNQLAIDEWLLKKADDTRSTTKAPPTKHNRRRGISYKVTPSKKKVVQSPSQSPEVSARPPARRSRPRRKVVIESSSPLQQPDSSSPIANRTGSSVLEIEESPQPDDHHTDSSTADSLNDSSLSRSSPPAFGPVTDAHIQLPEPPASWFIGAYDRFSSSQGNQRQITQQQSSAASQVTQLLPSQFESQSQQDYTEYQITGESQSEEVPVVASIEDRDGVGQQPGSSRHTKLASKSLSQSQSISQASHTEDVLQPVVPETESHRRQFNSHEQSILPYPGTLAFSSPQSQRSQASGNPVIEAAEGADLEEAIDQSRHLIATESQQLNKVDVGQVSSPDPSHNESSFAFQTQITSKTADPYQYRLPKMAAEDHHNGETEIVDNVVASGSEAELGNTGSSSFPNLPSKPLPSIGESAPSQVPAPVDSSTPSTQKSKPEILQLLKQNYYASKANRQPSDGPAPSTPAALPTTAAGTAALLQLNPTSPLLTFSDGMRSPSAVPAIEMIPEATKDDMNTSERYPTLLPQARTTNSETSQRTGSSHAASKHVSSYNAGERSVHVVPVPLLGHQRDQYFQKTYFYHDLFETFVESNSINDNEANENIDKALQALRNIATHPDLDNLETEVPSQTSQDIQAQWDVDSSAKFRFLKTLLLDLREEILHVAIISDSPRLLRIIDVFLSGIHLAHTTIHHNMAGPVTQQTVNNGLRVTVIDDRAAIKDGSAADIIVSFNPQATLDDPIISKLMAEDSTARAPILLVPVVPRTVEHIERCLLDVLDPATRRRALVKATLDYRDEAGRHENGQVGPKEAAQAIAEHIIKHETDEWPLVGLSTLEVLDSQTDSDVPQTVDGEANTASKRRLSGNSVDDQDAASKRQRTLPADDIPPATVNLQDVEITHVSDSGGRPTQDNFDLTEQIQRLQIRLDEHVQALSDLQYRHEDQRAQLIAVTAAHEKEVTRAANAVQRAAALDESNVTLRTERTNLKQQIADLNASLISHTIPERREYEVLRLAHAQALADKEKADRAAAQSAKEREYFSSAYQESSSHSHSLRQENAELRDQLAILQVRAAGEAARARDATRNTANRALAAQVQKLQALVRDREAGLKFRDEEIVRLKEAGRGRMGTRGSSVPRSPRLGSPLRGGNGRGSRATSPNGGNGEGRGRAGGTLHPLRNG